MALAISPLNGCATGLGAIFQGFVGGISGNPDVEDAMFSQAMLGFALVETILVIAMALVVLIMMV